MISAEKLCCLTAKALARSYKFNFQIFFTILCIFHWFKNRSQCRGLPLQYRQPESVPMQQADTAVQRSSDIAWETNWPCLSWLCLEGFVCLIVLRAQENYKGRIEGNKWKTSAGFWTIHCFILWEIKPVPGDLVRLQIKCLHVAHCMTWTEYWLCTLSGSITSNPASFAFNGLT